MIRLILFLAVVTSGCIASFGQRTNSESRQISEEEKQEAATYKYFFEYLPAVVANMSPEDDTYRLFDDSHFINSYLPERLGYTSPFTDEEVKTETIETDGKKIIILTFPEPRRMPFCLYVAFIPKNDHFATYMLEKSISFDNDSGECWVIGHKNSETIHQNYGSVDKRPSAKQFAKILKKKKLLE